MALGLTHPLTYMGPRNFLRVNVRPARKAIKIKTETIKKCFAKAGFGESDVADNLEEASTM
jgi:hypothetical protein